MSEQGVTGDKGKPLGTLEDRHESWDAPGLLQSDGAPWVTPIRPGGICRILDLDFVRATCAVFWRDNRGVPLFFDQDGRADCPCLVEEGRTTRTEEFRDVDSRHADELILAAHRDFVRRHGVV